MHNEDVKDFDQEQDLNLPENLVLKFVHVEVQTEPERDLQI